MVLKNSISTLILIMSSLTVMTRGNSTDCDRRCLANILVKKELLSAPQGDNCTIRVNITSIQYETLSFDTKEMQMNSRIKVNMQWKDSDLGWTNDTYRFPTVVLPVEKIWTPRIVLDNAVETTMEPYTNDVQVRRDGVVEHSVILFTTVSCEINLFNYPYVFGECPVAINGWSQKSCSLTLSIANNVTLISGSRGEWQTLSVSKNEDKTQEDRNYLFVTLSINPFGAFVTLILPSALIMLADLVSFALPFEGGERNSFKVTLVLSFTMFLLILNEHLPNGGNCSPLLHYHFSFCLVCLVLSMLISIVLTRLSVDGSILPCRRVKVHPTLDTQTHGSVDEEKDTDVIEKNSGGLNSQQAALQKIVKFLENMNKDDKQTDDTMAFSYRLDKILFYIFVFIYISYIIILICITRTDICKVNNLDFWDDSEYYDDNFDYSYNPD
ncbi:5-hydroxytryptamine receptor 3A-like isoform X1 [Triplophysa dalaica]|uniref:5-hydroxytryptamine receptor 3A-like isoform X1 n=1 Tax=Triplophysa dalaica TaxID=1582913 RepID=UPI0024DF39A5|nr:5-hydroxytryptamine receptor 3A-like isoform X1 [Triplophysa dalaica]